MASKDAVERLVHAWQENEPLCLLAATGCMAKVPTTKEIDRREVCENIKTLLPIVEHIGA